MLRLATSRQAKRRGNILIVTLALLALMAVVGITAVYYTKDQAERARIQGQPKGGGEGFSPDGTSAAMAFLNSFIYDTQDTGTGLLNPVRGHSLMATMYSRIGPGNPQPYHAWSGTGTFVQSTGPGPYALLDRSKIVNFSVQLTNPTSVYDPEYTALRPLPGAISAVGPGNGYFAKNAPYTYPDVKDYYLASISPATGEILLPSFHRPNLFRDGSQPPTATGLEPANTNWGSSAGPFLTLRPRPSDHGNNFPPIPQNPDGTYTGDVQNLVGGFGGNGIAKNDSLWMDIGLPAFTLPNGTTRVKPLVAPLILDMDGFLNLSMHGNSMVSGAHGSGQGFGPWEISLERALAANPTGAAEMRALVAARGLASTRSGLTSKAFYNRTTATPPNNEIPQYAQVAWNGFTGATPLQLPGATNLFMTSPTYTNGYSGQNAAVPHPSLFNPNEWLGGTSPKAFPVADLKILRSRYAPYPFDVSKLSFFTSAQQTLGGTRPIANPNPPAQTTPNQYRTDISHANRFLFTTQSNTLDRTGLVGSIVGGMAQATDANATLGAVNLNRTLADYRSTLTAALSSTNVANQATADQDRIQFANDIFARLVAACADSTTEASVVLATGAVTLNAAATPGTPQYEKIRTLAQLAANIVDYIDNDDISTRFPWNTTTPTEVVYGVEKPRLVLNEAYAEVVNDAADVAFTDMTKDAGMAPTDKAHVRFWVELQNPTNPTPAYTTATGGALGDGSVAFGALKPYMMEIVQNSKLGTGVANRLRVPTGTTTPADPQYTSNVKGDSGVAADLTFDFSPAGAMTIPPANGVAGAGIAVCAADVPPTPTDATVSAAWLDYRYTPPGAPASPQLIQGAAVGMANSLTYNTITLPTDSDMTLGDTSTGDGQKVSRHVILLRRLANPYIAYDATNNPYITVDVLDHVKAADRILLDKGKKFPMKRSARAAAAPPGFEPNPQSVGKTQPYASYADPTVATATALVYPTSSMVLPQDPTPAVTTSARQTLGRQNSKAATAPTTTTVVPTSDTLVAPYDWLVHMDRPLINQVELLHVSTGRSHDVTSTFIGANNVKYTGSTQTALLATTTTTFQQLYRALDLLTVQPYGHQMAIGGRVPGRININTIQDKRVWDALFDANGYNSFDQAYVDSLWNSLIRSRTVNTPLSGAPNVTDAAGAQYYCPIPGATVHDTGTAVGDRPFLPLGVATIPSPGVIGTGIAFGAGVGLDDTLLRRPAPVATSPPMIGVASATHPYQQAEALRKILNNTTTVSNTFAVWITVGYFEVTSEVNQPGIGTMARLGKEYYLQAPGDTRKKFFSIVDRSNVGLDLTNFNGGTYTHATVRPFFTTVEANPTAPNSIQISAASGTASSVTVYSDGQPVTITPSATPSVNSMIAVGTGANQEIVNVTAVNYAPTTGIATLTVAPPLTKRHYVGDCVSNVVPGNPGPQPNFDVNSDTYKPVVPLWVKLP